MRGWLVTALLPPPLSRATLKFHNLTETKPTVALTRDPPDNQTKRHTCLYPLRMILQLESSSKRPSTQRKGKAESACGVDCYCYCYCWSGKQASQSLRGRYSLAGMRAPKLAPTTQADKRTDACARGEGAGHKSPNNHGAPADMAPPPHCGCAYLQEGAMQVGDNQNAEGSGQQTLRNDPRSKQHSPSTPTTGLR